MLGPCLGLRDTSKDRQADGHTSPRTKGCTVEDVLGHRQEPFALWFRDASAAGYLRQGPNSYLSYGVTSPADGPIRSHSSPRSCPLHSGES